MNANSSRQHPGGVSAWLERALPAVVLAVAAGNWVGWSLGIEPLIKVVPQWPAMTPWTALLLGFLAVGVLAQSGRPSPVLVGIGRGFAATAGGLAAAILLEYLSATSFGLDQWWFGESVRHTMQTSWPGRPAPQTALSVVPLSIAITLTRVDRGWVRIVWPLCLLAAAVAPSITFVGYLFQALSLVLAAPSNGVAFSTASGLMLLVLATLLIRLDRNPVAWLLNRPDRRALLRTIAILICLPILIGLLRLVLLWLGVEDHATWALAIVMGGLASGVGVFYFSQREQAALIEKELLSRQRAEADARYRILAENAVDVIVRLRGRDVIWVSPSVEAAFGDPPRRWIGSDLIAHIHPEDREMVIAALRRIGPHHAVQARFRVGNGVYHWVEGHGKAYVDDLDDTSDVIMALRIVDAQVEAEQTLELLARFDTLTGLTNRTETITRLEAAARCSRSPGEHLGVLFCDVDGFKRINDTYGHSAGDAVLSALGSRIVGCVRTGDTVGRMGGDELLVLLPGVHNRDEIVVIAEKIRRTAEEPIPFRDVTVHATLSIGATIADPDEPVEILIARADAAMYEAKRSGGNAVAQI